jgi:curli biogenesis system outer membrane secretion channel CsgG
MTGPARLLRAGRAWAALVAVMALAAACTTTPQATATTKPLPAGRLPSAVSKMVCVTNAAHDLGLALGEKATVTKPTWVDHKYTCRYVYPSGAMTLSVKELSSPAETTAYFKSLGTQLGTAQTLANLGQGAFQTTSGSVVVRKDYKVLLVDISALPPKFGNPPTGPAEIAVTVAIVILGCWAGD